MLPDRGPVYTCPACNEDYYRNEMERVGLIWYCRYCLSEGDVPGVAAENAVAARNDMCWACGRLGCEQCNGDTKTKDMQ